MKKSELKQIIRECYEEILNEKIDKDYYKNIKDNVYHKDGNATYYRNGTRKMGNSIQKLYTFEYKEKNNPKAEWHQITAPWAPSAQEATRQMLKKYPKEKYFLSYKGKSARVR